MAQRRSRLAGAWAAALGLLLWALAMTTSLGIAAGGHGWITPFFVSLPLVVLYPLALARARLSAAGSIRADWALIGAALVLNALLVGRTCLVEGGNFSASLRLGPGPVLLWVALWLGWQAVAVATLVERRGAAECGHSAG